MTKLISNLRAFLFGTSEPPLQAGTLYEHVHVGRRLRLAREGRRKRGGRDQEKASLEVSGG